jgi:hypothetical protein
VPHTLNQPRPERYRGMFVGDDAGTWEYWPDIRLGHRQLGWTWEAALGLTRGTVLDVEGATQHHRGLRRALPGMVAAYPELRGFELRFDGHALPVIELLTVPRGALDWPAITFLHGTSSAVVPQILRHGLIPLGAGRPIYGASVQARPGRPDCVYLTTQPGTAHFAAREAARLLGGSPTVLAITGLPGDRLLPDLDSETPTAEDSLMRLGSVAHRGRIPPTHLHVHEHLDRHEWIPG